MRNASRKWSFLVVVLLLAPWPVRSADRPATMPVADVHPGMQGCAYTIFEGDQVEKIDLEVIGVLHNAIGPKLDVILVRLLGEKVQQTGVVAGMSGSPVYIDDKLVGALALKLGSFTKEAIAGVTPIADMLEIEQSPATPASKRGVLASTWVSLPQAFVHSVPAGTGGFLVPIDTPL